MVNTRYKMPGVYREDVLARPDEALPTAVPAFIGLLPEPFANGAVRLTLWDEFVKLRPHWADDVLAQAVRGFFANGGRLCYVIGVNGSWSQNTLGDALARVDAIDEVDLVAAPGLAQLPLQQLVLEHCDTRPGGRFAILDAPQGATWSELLAQREPPHELPHELLRGTSGALYYPWIDVGVRDKDGHPLYIPPCGHVAGAYARSDRTSGVHKSPANEVLEGAINLDLQLSLTPGQQGRLNEAGVNCLRAIPGRGIRIWGARTLSADPAWRYIGVRRLFLTIGRWVERNLQAAVYEPNDRALWAQIERELGAYCAGLFRQGMLAGRSAQDAYYVKCDAETNPAATRERGEVVIEVGLRPTATSEFVFVRIFHDVGGVAIGTPASV